MLGFNLFNRRQTFSTFGFESVLGQLSLFSIVQFPNQECTSDSSPTQKGTCVTASECTTMTGTADGNCAAGFGVCCVISTSTCGSSVSTNITYIRNPSYPSSLTLTSTGTCSFTVKKASDDVCQLREGLKIRHEILKKFKYFPFPLFKILELICETLK